MSELEKETTEETVNGWKGDKLNRKKDSIFLTSYIKSRYLEQDADESFVLNINAEWGFGKTFFLKNWKTDLKKNYPVIYYDAWKNDYSKNPLTSFIYEFQSQISDFYIDDTDGIKDVTKSLLLTGLKCAASSVIPNGKDLVSDVVNMFIENQEETKKEIEGFTRKISKIGKYFKEKRKDLNLPIYVMIDELDRCRPTFSIELLESIKHLFCSKYVCFVIATDSRQLEKSIKVIYGNEFDSGRYLNRFFDHEYLLSEPNNLSFSSYLFEKYDLNDDIFVAPFGTNNEAFSVLADYFRLPLREQIHAASLLQAIKFTADMSLSESVKDVDLFYITFLMMLKLKDNDIFLGFYKSDDREAYFHNYVAPLKDLDTSTTIFTKETKDSLADPLRGVDTIVKMPIVDLIHFYVKTMNRDLNESRLNSDNERYQAIEAASNRIISQQPRFQKSGAPPSYPDIKSYFEIITRVGQLTY